MSFDYDFIADSGTDVGALVTQILSKNPGLAYKASQKTKDTIVKIVRRSLGKTGSTIFRELKKGLKTGDLVIGASFRRYSQTQQIMMSEALRQGLNSDSTLTKEIKSRYERFSPGEKFAGLMQYYMKDDKDRSVETDVNTLEIGLIPSRRGGDDWARNFSDWQEKGDIKVQEFRNYNRRSMLGFFAKLGMPLKETTILQRPARPVISTIREQYDPSALFEKFFIERISK